MVVSDMLLTIDRILHAVTVAFHAAKKHRSQRVRNRLSTRRLIITTTAWTAQMLDMEVTGVDKFVNGHCVEEVKSLDWLFPWSLFCPIPCIIFSF